MGQAALIREPQIFVANDEQVDRALFELEEVVRGCEGEQRAREALTILRRAFDAVRASATTDALTGLANRVCFSDLVDRRLGASGSGACKAALLFLDLDGFKLVNDERGHAAGDALLADVARRIAGSLRDHDLVARHGGDEFVVMLENIESRSVAHAVAARVVEALAAPFPHGDEMVHLGVSIGVAFYPEHGRSTHELLQNADRAMYRAKSLGGCGYAVYEEREELGEPRAPLRSWAWELTVGHRGSVANDVAAALAAAEKR